MLYDGFSIQAASVNRRHRDAMVARPRRLHFIPNERRILTVVLTAAVSLPK